MQYLNTNSILLPHQLLPQEFNPNVNAFLLQTPPGSGKTVTYLHLAMSLACARHINNILVVVDKRDLVPQVYSQLNKHFVLDQRVQALQIHCITYQDLLRAEPNPDRIIVLDNFEYFFAQQIASKFNDVHALQDLKSLHQIDPDNVLDLLEYKQPLIHYFHQFIGYPEIHPQQIESQFYILCSHMLPELVNCQELLPNYHELVSIFPNKPVKTFELVEQQLEQDADYVDPLLSFFNQHLQLPFNYDPLDVPDPIISMFDLKLVIPETLQHQETPSISYIFNHLLPILSQKQTLFLYQHNRDYDTLPQFVQKHSDNADLYVPNDDQCQQSLIKFIMGLTQFLFARYEDVAGIELDTPFLLVLLNLPQINGQVDHSLINQALGRLVNSQQQSGIAISMEYIAPHHVTQIQQNMYHFNLQDKYVANHQLQLCYMIQSDAIIDPVDAHPQLQKIFQHLYTNNQQLYPEKTREELLQITDESFLQKLQQYIFIQQQQLQELLQIWTPETTTDPNQQQQQRDPPNQPNQLQEYSTNLAEWEQEQTTKPEYEYYNSLI